MSKVTIRPLLATKLFIPPIRENLVVRPRLLERLDERQDRRLLLVTAPPGFGKSVLVSCWLTKRKKRAAWISLDKYDNDLLLFLSYIVEALGQVEPNMCETISPLLKLSEPPAVRTLLSYLINDLACLSKPCLLVLDDFHVIYADEVHQALDFIIENAPPTLRIILISRHTPQISIARLRGQNELLELNAADLRFNPFEIRQFFHDVMQMPLSERDLNVLEKQTEGWITGLQLAALGMKEESNPSHFIRAFSGDDRFIADYLIDEVLSEQDETIQRFLIQTSILHRFTPALCDELLEIDNARQILLQLENDNLFLIPLDNRRQWFRYHHLFSEMLRSRLELRWPDFVPALFRKATDWHAANGQFEDAIGYALAGQDFERAADLLESIIDQMQTGIRRRQLLNWMEQLPRDVLRMSNELWPQYILAQFYFSDFSEALKTLERLWQDAPTDEAQATLVRAIEYPLRSAIALHTTLDARRVQALNRQALVNLPANFRLMRGIAMGHYGSASLLLGDLNAARTYLADAIELIEKTNSWSIVLVFKNYLAEATAVQGYLHQAAKIFQQNYHYAHNHNLQEGATFSGTLIGLGLLHFEWNEMAEAEKLIYAGRHMADSSKSIDRLLQACCASVKLHLAKGEFPDIETRLDRIEQVAAEYDYPLLVMDRVESVRSLLALRQGNEQTAARWAHLFALRHKKEIYCANQHEWEAVARIWLHTRKGADAVTLLQQLQQLAQKENRQRDWVSITASLVDALCQTGEEAQALSELNALLPIAEPEGYLRTFLEKGEGMRQLLETLLAGNGRTSSHSTYVQQILNAFVPDGEYTQNEPVLTPREREVVGLLSEGLTYAQIQDQLTITENTLKTHIKHIYSKLEVHNRVQAILAAQEKRLL